MLSLVGSLFLCSFSSIFSAILLIFSTFLVIFMMYWNLVEMLPLYLFSLFMLGGLYVLIGFIMMADMSDMDMIVSGSKVSECAMSFVVILLGFELGNMSFSNLNLGYCSFSPIKSFDWSTWGLLSGVFLFLIFMLFIYLFILHMMMKGSSSGGGFVK